MGADFALGQADGLYKCIHPVEFKGSEAEHISDALHHAAMLGGIGVSIFFQILILITFQILDDTTGHQLQVGLATAETEERATIDKRRTGYAHVYLLGSIVEKHLHIVLQLGTAYNGVVAEKQTFARHHGAVGNELHLGDKLNHRFVDGRGFCKLLHRAAQDQR